jgi:hypothetical protein
MTHKVTMRARRRDELARDAVAAALAGELVLIIAPTLEVARDQLDALLPHLEAAATLTSTSRTIAERITFHYGDDAESKVRPLGWSGGFIP